ncbi:MAG: DcrB-related protein [Gaiellales bacterium]
MTDGDAQVVADLTGQPARVAAGAVSVPLPPGWEDRTVPTIVGPASSGAQPNVVVTRETLCNSMGLGGFSTGWVQKLADQVPVLETRPVEHIAISGHPGHLRCVEWEAAGLRLRQLVGLTTVGPDAYAIVCTVHSSDFDELEPTLRALIEGVEIGEGAAEHAAP